jgi:hypothetical protein
MGSDANRVAIAKVVGSMNAKFHRIKRLRGCVRLQRLAKLAEEQKSHRPHTAELPLTVTNDELHVNHVFVTQIINPERATFLVREELAKASAFGLGAVAKIRDHPSRLDDTVGTNLRLNRKLQNRSNRYTQDLMPGSGVDDAVQSAMKPLLECARSPPVVARDAFC